MDSGFIEEILIILKFFYSLSLIPNNRRNDVEVVVYCKGVLRSG